jgi:hypothetical protein
VPQRGRCRDWRLALVPADSRDRRIPEWWLDISILAMWANDEVCARWEGAQGYFTAGLHFGRVRLYLSGRQISLDTDRLLDPTVNR